MLFGQKTNNLILTSILILLMSVGLFSIPVYGSSAYNVGGNSYELTDDAGFDITGKNKLDYLSSLRILVTCNLQPIFYFLLNSRNI